MMRVLRIAGWEVDAAGNGAAARRLARESAPDVIVVDRGLPDVDGTELVRELRETLGTGMPPVILASRRDDVAGGTGLPALAKLFTPRELSDAVRTAALEGRRAHTG